MPENLVSRDGFSRPVPRQPAHPHTQAESGAYLRDSSRVPRRCPFFMKPPYAIGSVPSLSGHAIAYRWRSRGQEDIHFLCSADHEQDWQPYPVDPYSANHIHTYIHTAESPPAQGQ